MEGGLARQEVGRACLDAAHRTFTASGMLSVSSEVGDVQSRADRRPLAAVRVG